MSLKIIFVLFRRSSYCMLIYIWLIERSNLIWLIVIIWYLNSHKFWNIFKKKHVEEEKHEEKNIYGLPYLAIFFNCMMWVIYRLPNVQPHCHCTGILIINIVGICFQLLYLTIVLVFYRRNRVCSNLLLL